MLIKIQNFNYVKIAEEINIKSIESTIAIVSSKTKEITEIGYNGLEKSLEYLPNWRIISYKEFRILFTIEDFNKNKIMLRDSYWISDSGFAKSYAKCIQLIDYNNNHSSYNLLKKARNKKSFGILIKDTNE